MGCFVPRSKGGRSNPFVASQCRSLLLSISADVGSSGDVIAFEGPLRDRLLQCEAKLRSTELDARRRLVQTKEHATAGASKLKEALDAALLGEQHALTVVAARMADLQRLAAGRLKEQASAAQKQAVLGRENELYRAKTNKLAATIAGLQREVAASTVAKDRMAAREMHAVERLQKLEATVVLSSSAAATGAAVDLVPSSASSAPAPSSATARVSGTAIHAELAVEASELRRRALHADAEVAALKDQLRSARETVGKTESDAHRANEGKLSAERRLDTATVALQAAQLTVGELKITVQERNRAALDLERRHKRLQHDVQQRQLQLQQQMPPSLASSLPTSSTTGNDSSGGGGSNRDSNRNGRAQATVVDPAPDKVASWLWQRVQAHLAAQEPLRLEAVTAHSTAAERPTSSSAASPVSALSASSTIASTIGTPASKLAATVWRLTWRSTASERLAAWALQELESATVNLESTHVGLQEAVLDLQRKDGVCSGVVQQQVVASLQKRESDLSLQLDAAAATIARRDRELEQARVREAWALKRARLLQRLPSPSSSSISDVAGDGAGDGAGDHTVGGASSHGAATAAAFGLSSSSSSSANPSSKQQQQQQQSQLEILRELLTHETSVEAILATAELASDRADGSSRYEHAMDQVAALEAQVGSLAATNSQFAYALEVVLSGALPPAGVREHARQVLSAPHRSDSLPAPLASEDGASSAAASAILTATATATARSPPLAGAAVAPPLVSSLAPASTSNAAVRAAKSDQINADAKAKAKAKLLATEKRTEAARAAKVAAAQLAALKGELSVSTKNMAVVEAQLADVKRERDRDRSRKDALIQGLRGKLTASQAEAAAAQDGELACRTKWQRLETKRGADHAVISGLRKKVEQLATEAAAAGAHHDLLSESRNKTSQLQEKLARKVAQTETAVAKCAALEAELATRDGVLHTADAAVLAQKKYRAECKRLRALLLEAGASRTAEVEQLKAQEVQIAQLEYLNAQLQKKVPPKKPRMVHSGMQTSNRATGTATAADTGWGEGGGSGGGGGGEHGGTAATGGGVVDDDVIDNVKAILNLTDAEYAAMLVGQ